MKRLLFLIAAIICGQVVLAQLEPLSSQYMLNTLAINPAYAGSREALSITLLHRNQWTGFEGAPKTETLALHAPLRNESVGLGLLAMSDRAGVSDSKIFTGNFAYRIFAGSGVLSLGLGGGISIVRNRWNELVAVDPDDDALPLSAGSYILPDFSIGIYYHNDRFYGGLSMPMFLTHHFNAASGSFELVNDFTQYTYLLHGGTLFHLSARWSILPSAMIRFSQVSTPQADINLHAGYHERAWLGFSYRTNKSLIGMFIVQVNNQLALAYSYDTGFGHTGSSLGGSHEIMIRYDFRYIIDVINPRYF
jgi:type IX secretion system PorP/SprF family membrane protein